MANIRIAGGRQKGRKFHSTSAIGFRPTTERVRSAVYSMIGVSAIEGARVLDLYAGIGSFGIEALSRGAVQADFVEENSLRCKDIRTTLRATGLSEYAQVRQGKVEKILTKMNSAYDLIFMDPPYSFNLWDQLMELITESGVLKDKCTVIAEHMYKQQLEDGYGRLQKSHSRRYGDTSISIYIVRESDG